MSSLSYCRNQLVLNLRSAFDGERNAHPAADKSDPPQVSPSAYEIGFGQLADAEVYHEIAERWRAVTRDHYELRCL
jgi:hypothetical protein